MRTHLQIQGDEFIPCVLARIAQRIHPIYPANIWPFGVDAARLVGHVVVPARSIATIQKPCFIGKVNMLATQAALGAGEWFHQTFKPMQAMSTRCERFA